LKNDGTVVTWGSGAGTNVPAGLSGIIAIAAGSTHSLALRTNGTVIAWGSGAATNLPTVASGLTNIIALSASSYTDNQSLCLALRADGVVIGWGTSTYGENIPPSALKSLFSVSAVAAPSHGLALVNDGTPQFIQPPVGLSAYTARNVTLSAKAVGAAPLVYQWLLNGGAISGATNATLLLPNIQPTDAGNYQLLVTNLLGSVLSLPATVNVISNSPLVFLSQTTVSSTNVYQGGVVRFTAGALQGSGPVRYQWFYSPTNKNYNVIPNVTNDTLSLDPALVAQSGSYYVAVSNSVGGITSAPVTLRVQFAKTWGYLAADPPTNLVVSNAIAVAVGNSGRPSASGHYLALRSDGKITPWAATVDANTYGQTNVSPLTNFIVTAVAAGYQDSLALKSDGTVYAWGLNQYGETNVPSSLASGGVTAIACGDYHDLALKSDGTIVGWGQNTYLQTSNAAATNVVAVAASGNNSMILRADGTVVNWGGYSTIPGYPQLNAASLTNIIAIACGNSHFIALRANGTVVSWGDTTYGQVSTAGWSNIVAIAAAGTHSLGLRNDGTVVSSGAIAYPYTANSATNAPPTDLANVVAISAGGDHDVALFGARAPVFTVQPWNRAVTVSPAFGTSFTLVGKVAGVQPMSYQWRLNGTNYPGATNDTFVWRDSQHPAGTYQLVASNAYGVAISKPAKVTIVIPLAAALDTTTLNWLTSGSSPWYGQTNYVHPVAGFVNLSAARSGGIGGSQETILQTTLVTNLPGSISFWWKVSSEQFFDTLEFRINGTVQAIISGEADWQLASFPVAAGTNVLMWRYSKDSSFDSGLDAAFVDQFSFVSAPVINVQPAGVVANLGQTVQLRVVAAGIPSPDYQWRQNGNPVGGNSSVLTLSSVARAQGGTYSVIVTNAGGMAISSNAAVVVKVPQVLSAPVLLPDGSLQLTSADANGSLLTDASLANFEAQASSDLVNWVTLTNGLSLTNGMLQLNDTARTNFTSRYYRIVEH
jgi:alpha-tubulin suppressor-like RCC1 family protein